MNNTHETLLAKQVLNFIIENQWKDIVAITCIDLPNIVRMLSTLFLASGVIFMHRNETFSSKLDTYFHRGSHNIVVFCDTKQTDELNTVVRYIGILGKNVAWLFIHESKSIDFLEFLTVTRIENFMDISSNVFCLMTHRDLVETYAVKLVHQRTNSIKKVALSTEHKLDIRQIKHKEQNSLPLNGYELKIATCHAPPWNYISGNYPTRGFTFDVLKILAKYLGFRYTFVILPKLSYGTLKNGSWTGIVGTVHRMEADVGLGLSLTSDRAEFLDYSTFISEARFVVVIRRSTDTSQEWNLFLFTKPFSILVWISYSAMCALVLPIMSFTLTKYKSFIRPPNTTANKCNILSVLWNLVCVLLQKGVAHLTSLLSYHIVFQSFSVFVLLMTTTYGSLLTAYLTMKTEPKQYNSLEEVIDARKFGITLVPGTSIVGKLKNANSGVFQDAWKKIQNNPTASFVNSIEDGIEISKTKKKVFLTSEPLGLTGVVNSKCALEFLRKPFDKSTVHLFFQKNSPLAEIFSLKILAMKSSGVLKKLHQKHFSTPDPTACKTRPSMRIPVQQAVGIFIILVTGFIFSVIFYFLEILYKKYSRNN